MFLGCRQLTREDHVTEVVHPVLEEAIILELECSTSFTDRLKYLVEIEDVAFYEGT